MKYRILGVIAIIVLTLILIPLSLQLYTILTTQPTRASHVQCPDEYEPRNVGGNGLAQMDWQCVRYEIVGPL